MKHSPEQKVFLSKLFRAFLKLGLISFGGPVAHVSYFHQEFVVKRRWLDEAAFADLLALCQFLPGPTSSQMVFAIGLRRAGLPGGLDRFVLFHASLSHPDDPLWLRHFRPWATCTRPVGCTGLKLAAVAVVAQAVWNMGRKLCPDPARQALCLGAATLILALSRLALADRFDRLGALLGWWIYRGEVSSSGEAARLHLRAHLIAGACLAVFLGLLFVLPVAAALPTARCSPRSTSFTGRAPW